MGVRIVPGIPTTSAGLSLPLSVSRCELNGSHMPASPGHVEGRALTSVFAVTHKTLGWGCLWCAGVAEGGTETARSGPDLEEADRKSGRKEPPPWGLTPQGRCLYAGAQVQVSASLSQAPSSGHSVISKPFHPTKAQRVPESLTFCPMDTVTGNDRVRVVLKPAFLCPVICF